MKRKVIHLIVAIFILSVAFALPKVASASPGPANMPDTEYRICGTPLEDGMFDRSQEGTQPEVRAEMAGRFVVSNTYSRNTGAFFVVNVLGELAPYTDLDGLHIYESDTSLYLVAARNYSCVRIYSDGLVYSYIAQDFLQPENSNWAPDPFMMYVAWGCGILVVVYLLIRLIRYLGRRAYKPEVSHTTHSATPVSTQGSHLTVIVHRDRHRVELRVDWDPSFSQAENGTALLKQIAGILLMRVETLRENVTLVYLDGHNVTNNLCHRRVTHGQLIEIWLRG